MSIEKRESNEKWSQSQNFDNGHTFIHTFSKTFQLVFSVVLINYIWLWPCLVVYINTWFSFLLCMYYKRPWKLECTVILSKIFIFLFSTKIEKVDKQQLNWKWFKICQTISCFGAFLLTLSLTKIPKLASKSVKLCTLMQIFIESIYVKFLPTLLEKIHTNPPSPSLTYFQVQLFPSPYLAYASYSTEKSASTAFTFFQAGKNNQLHRCTP